jgi:putative hydrolase of the HAD superfamily
MKNANEYDVLALDAMGVIYQSGDDVAELLIPFIAANGGCTDGEFIEQAYLRASLGELTSAEFWRLAGIDPGLEDSYLSLHRLTDGIRDLLIEARHHAIEVCCISNDVAEWSVALRRRFRLESLIEPWFISGDIGIRKPGRGIYQAALAGLGCEASKVLFVDDRIRNLDAARELGIATVWLPLEPGGTGDHRRAGSVNEILGFVRTSGE